MPDTDTLVQDIAKKHGVSEDAVRTAHDALRKGNGTMAQFSHPDFGGMAQWSKGGMSMVGDMFNTDMKAKLDGVLADLAKAPASKSENQHDHGDEQKAGSSQSSGQWWPDDLGQPSSSGSQNDMRYAFFPDSHRLVVEDAGKRKVYDTGDHMISGVSQQQSATRTLSFSSQNGDVDLATLKTIG